MKPLYWFMRLVFLTYFRLFHRHSVYGIENIVKGQAIIAPNHASYFDPPLVCASCPEEISFLAKKTLFSLFFFGSLIKKLNAYPVSGTPGDHGSLKLIYKLLSEKKKVVIFAEGFRSHEGQLNPIKQGIGMIALRSQAPIIPCYIYGTFHVWNRYRRYPRLFGKTACVFGKPIYWDNYKHMEKKAAQEAIIQRLTESITELKTEYEHMFTR